jgi:hypothetical protein
VSGGGGGVRNQTDNRSYYRYICMLCFTRFVFGISTKSSNRQRSRFKNTLTDTSTSTTKYSMCIVHIRSTQSVTMSHSPSIKLNTSTTRTRHSFSLASLTVFMLLLCTTILQVCAQTPPSSFSSSSTGLSTYCRDGVYELPGDFGVFDDGSADDILQQDQQHCWILRRHGIASAAANITLMFSKSVSRSSDGYLTVYKLVNDQWSALQLNERSDFWQTDTQTLYTAAATDILVQFDTHQRVSANGAGFQAHWITTPGTASTNVSTSCMPGTLCTPGIGITQAPAICPEGYYCPLDVTIGTAHNTSTTTQLPCSSGTWCPEGSANSEPCPALGYCSIPSVRIPYQCAPGYYCSTVGATSRAVLDANRALCPRGSVCPFNSITPTTCTIPDDCPYTGMTEHLPSFCKTIINLQPISSSNSSSTVDFGVFSDGTEYHLTHALASGICWVLPQGAAVVVFSKADVGGTNPLSTKLQVYAHRGSVQRFFPAEPFVVYSGIDLLVKFDVPDGPIPAEATGFVAHWLHGDRSLSTSCLPGIICDFGLNGALLVCPAGYNCPLTIANDDSSTTTQVECNIGEYCPAGTGDTSPCKRGWICPTPTSVPTACPAGQYCNTTNSTSLADANAAICPVGYFCPEASGLPAICSAGHYCPTTGLAAAIPLPAGSWSSVTGANTTLVSQNCPIGYICAQGSASPTICPAGYTCPSAGLAAAIALPAGSWSDAGVPVFAVPQPCPIGSWCPPASSSPPPCPEGYYCPVINSTTPLICPGGVWYCPAGSGKLSTLSRCPAGTLSLKEDLPGRLDNCQDCTPRCNASSSQCIPPYNDQSAQCFICEFGYYNRVETCFKCWPQWLLIVLISIFLTGFIVVLLLLQRRRFQMAMLRLTANFLQVASFVVLVAAAWPDFFTRLYDAWQKWLSFEFGSLQLQCFTGHLNIEQRAAVNGVGAFGIMALLLVLGFVLRAVHKIGVNSAIKASAPNADSESAEDMMDRVAIALTTKRYSLYAFRAASLVLLLVLPAGARLLFELAYRCTGERWAEDQSVRCASRSSGWLQGAAGALIGVVFLVAIGVYWFLVRTMAAIAKKYHRSFIDRDVSAWKLAFSDTYKPHLWFWDLTVLAYKLGIVFSLTLVAQLAGDHTHWPATVCAFIVCLYSALVFSQQPFRCEPIRVPSTSWMHWLNGFDAANTDEVIGSACLGFAFIIAALLTEDVLDRYVGAWLIISSNLVFVLFGIALPVRARMQMAALELSVDHVNLHFIARGMTQSYVQFKGFSLQKLDECQEELIDANALPKVTVSLLRRVRVSIHAARSSLVSGQYEQALHDFEHMHLCIMRATNDIQCILDVLYAGQNRHELKLRHCNNADTSIDRSKITSLKRNAKYLLSTLKALQNFEPSKDSVVRMTAAIVASIARMRADASSVTLAATIAQQDDTMVLARLPTPNYTRAKTFGIGVPEVELAILRADSTQYLPPSDEIKQLDIDGSETLDADGDSKSNAFVISDAMRVYYVREATKARELVLKCEHEAAAEALGEQDSVDVSKDSKESDSNESNSNSAGKRITDWQFETVCKLLISKLHTHITVVIEDMQADRIEAAKRNDVAAWVEASLVMQLRIKSLRSILRYRCAYAAAYCGVNHRPFVQLSADLYAVSHSTMSRPYVLSALDNQTLRELRARLHSMASNEQGLNQAAAQVQWMELAEHGLNLRRYHPEFIEILDAFGSMCGMPSSSSTSASNTSVHSCDDPASDVKQVSSVIGLPVPDFMVRAAVTMQVPQNNNLSAKPQDQPGLHIFDVPMQTQHPIDMTQRCRRRPGEVHSVPCLKIRAGNILEADEDAHNRKYRTITLLGLTSDMMQRLTESPPDFSSCRDLLEQLGVDTEQVKLHKKSTFTLNCFGRDVHGKYDISDLDAFDDRNLCWRIIGYICLSCLWLVLGVPLFLIDLAAWALQFCSCNMISVYGEHFDLDTPLNSQELYAASAVYLKDNPVLINRDYVQHHLGEMLAERNILMCEARRALFDKGSSQPGPVAEEAVEADSDNGSDPDGSDDTKVQ